MYRRQPTTGTCASRCFVFQLGTSCPSRQLYSAENSTLSITYRTQYGAKKSLKRQRHTYYHARPLALNEYSTGRVGRPHDTLATAKQIPEKTSARRGSRAHRTATRAVSTTLKGYQLTGMASESRLVRVNSLLLIWERTLKF